MKLGREFADPDEEHHRLESRMRENRTYGERMVMGSATSIIMYFRA